MVGGSNPGRPTLSGSGGGSVIYAGPGVEPPTQGAAAGCITTRPLLGLRCRASLLLFVASATDKKPKLCVCLLSCLGTDWRTVNLSSRCTAEGNIIFWDRNVDKRYILPKLHVLKLIRACTTA